jgi:hypothetical protein
MLCGVCECTSEAYSLSMAGFDAECCVQAMMGCLVHVALGEWRRMADDLDEMGFLKAKIDKDELAIALEEEVVKVWPLAGSFGTASFLMDGTAQPGGALASRIADGTVRPELGLGQGLTFGKLAKVRCICLLFVGLSECEEDSFCWRSWCVFWLFPKWIGIQWIGIQCC